MAEAFAGRWKQTSCDGLEKFLNLPGLRENENMEGMMARLTDTSDTSMEHVITIDGQECKTELYDGGKLLKTIIVTFGEECEVTGMDGTKFMTTTTVEGNKMVAKSVGDKSYDSIGEVNGNELTLTLTDGDISAVRKYKRI